MAYLTHAVCYLKRFAGLLIFAVACNCQAQTGPCQVKLAELPSAPELFGFRLGMTMEQVKTRVPQVSFLKPDELGSSKTSISPDFDPRFDKATFQGIRTVSLDFLDGHLTSLWLGYDSTFKWKTVDAFVKGISQSLRLPEAWRPWRARGQQLSCSDFQMTVTIVSEGPSFRILDQTAAEMLAARRQAKEEQEAAVEESASQPEEIVADRNARVYYPPACQPAKAISDTDRVMFKNIEEAERAGYKRFQHCPENSPGRPRF